MRDIIFQQAAKSNFLLNCISFSRGQSLRERKAHHNVKVTIFASGPCLSFYMPVEYNVFVSRGHVYSTRLFLILYMLPILESVKSDRDLYEHLYHVPYFRLSDEIQPYFL